MFEAKIDAIIRFWHSCFMADSPSTSAWDMSFSCRWRVLIVIYLVSSPKHYRLILKLAESNDDSKFVVGNDHKNVLNKQVSIVQIYVESKTK